MLRILILLPGSLSKSRTISKACLNSASAFIIILITFTQKLLSLLEHTTCSQSVFLLRSTVQILGINLGLDKSNGIFDSLLTSCSFKYCTYYKREIHRKIRVIKLFRQRNTELVQYLVERKQFLDHSSSRTKWRLQMQKC